MAAAEECAGPYADVEDRIGLSSAEDAKLAGGKVGVVLRWFFSADLADLPGRSRWPTCSTPSTPTARCTRPARSRWSRRSA